MMKSIFGCYSQVEINIIVRKLHSYTTRCSVGFMVAFGHYKQIT